MTPSQYNAHCFCMFLSCWNLPKTDWIVWWLLICSSFLWKMVMPDSWLLITILIIQKTSQFFGVNEETSPKNHPAKNLLFSQLGHVPSLKLTARTWNGDDPSRTPAQAHLTCVASPLHYPPVSKQVRVPGVQQELQNAPGCWARANPHPGPKKFSMPSIRLEG